MSFWIIASLPLALAIGCSSADIEIVIARYNEDVSWLNEYPYSCYKQIIYNKGPYPVMCGNAVQCVVENVPNVGRCDHTYLYHIITKYNALSNVTVFLPGSMPYNPPKVVFTDRLMRGLETSPGTIFPGPFFSDGVLKTFDNFSMTEWMATDKANAAINPEKALHPCPERPLGVWYRKNFPNVPVIRPTGWHGIFSVDRVHITQHPLEYYENLIKYLNTSSNPECGQYFEISWGAVFYPYPGAFDGTPDTNTLDAQAGSSSSYKANLLLAIALIFGVSGVLLP